MTLFPPKPKKAGPKPLVALRLPSDVADYIEALKKKGYGVTEAMVQLVRLGRDVEQEAAPDLARIEQLAAAEGVTVGRMLGVLAREGLAGRAARSGKR